MHGEGDSAGPKDRRLMSPNDDGLPEALKPPAGFGVAVRVDARTSEYFSVPQLAIVERRRVIWRSGRLVRLSRRG